VQFSGQVPNINKIFMDAHFLWRHFER
jgi:hypothetical protein